MRGGAGLGSSASAPILPVRHYVSRCTLFRCYRDCGGHRRTGVTSAFEIQYHPLQLFEMIKPALWCKGYSRAGICQQLLAHNHRGW